MSSRNGVSSPANPYKPKTKAMSYKITSYSGFFYVIDKNTGKLLIEQSFKSYDDAIKNAKRWSEYLAK